WMGTSASTVESKARCRSRGRATVSVGTWTGSPAEVSSRHPRPTSSAWTSRPKSASPSMPPARRPISCSASAGTSGEPRDTSPELDGLLASQPGALLLDQPGAERVEIVQEPDLVPAIHLVHEVAEGRALSQVPRDIADDREAQPVVHELLREVAK